jgi:hypothetical protein
MQAVVTTQGGTVAEQGCVPLHANPRASAIQEDRRPRQPARRDVAQDVAAGERHDEEVRLTNVLRVNTDIFRVSSSRFFLTFAACLRDLTPADADMALEVCSVERENIEHCHEGWANSWEKIKKNDWSSHCTSMRYTLRLYTSEALPKPMSISTPSIGTPSLSTTRYPPIGATVPPLLTYLSHPRLPKPQHTHTQEIDVSIHFTSPTSTSGLTQQPFFK